MEKNVIDPERLESAKQMFKNAMALLTENDIYYDEAIVYRILREGIRALLLFDDIDLNLLNDDVKVACDGLHNEVWELLNHNDIFIRKFLSENYY